MVLLIDWHSLIPIIVFHLLYDWQSLSTFATERGSNPPRNCLPIPRDVVSGGRKTESIVD